MIHYYNQLVTIACKDNEERIIVGALIPVSALLSCSFRNMKKSAGFSILFRSTHTNSERM